MKLFTVTPCGDPYNRAGWDVHEYANSFDEPTCVFRGDLSPIQGKARTIQTLRRLYPGCRIRVEK
jgi:hypothetical protein